MITCKICHYHYSEALRNHCPTCGAFKIFDTYFDIDTVKQLVIAYGAQRQDYARTVKMRVTSCDPDQ